MKKAPFIIVILLLLSCPRGFSQGGKSRAYTEGGAYTAQRIGAAGAPGRMVMEDVMETLIERNPEADVSEMEEMLLELMKHPIELNRATEEDLEQLFWLTPEQRVQILLYVYHHPMQTIYELQLVPTLKDYDIRNMLPFVTVDPRASDADRSMTDYLRNASHEVDIRADARNLQQIKGDPVYGQIRYSLQGGDRVKIGAVMKREPGEVPNAHSRYGAYAELHFDRSAAFQLKTLVVGDYRANFGLGLVMNAALPISKTDMAANIGMGKPGLKKYGGASDSFMRGAGATMRMGHVELSTFYSMRMPKDSLWQQTAGVNLQYRKNRLRVGMTAVNFWTKDSLAVRDNYYNANYFRGDQQFAASVHFQYGWRSLMLLGELATAQNEHWGAAGILGARLIPVQDVSLMILGRYYSPWYDARYASSFGEGSRANDEHGIYIGTDITKVKRWKLSAYTDFFHFTGPKYMIRDSLSWGYDVMATAMYLPSRRMDMLLRGRVKSKGQREQYSLRWQMNNHWRDWSLRSQADANMVRKTEGEKEGGTKSRSYGVSVFEQVEYRAPRVPLTVQWRIQGFYIPNYDNRVYTYENDVLYSFSIPMVYGLGGRGYINLRYKITDLLSLYFRVSDTWYTQSWATAQSQPQHKTEVHVMVRLHAR